MKLFTGIELAPAVARAAGTLIDELKRKAEQQAPRARVTWVTEERLHVTVRFIGHTDEAGYDRIRAVLEPPIDVAPFAFIVERLGSFPPSGQPRVLWAGISGDEASLRSLEHEVTARLVPAGIPPEPRDYNPHLTLGRVKEAGGLKAATLFRDRTDIVLGTTSVQAITLFESRVSSKGPTYVPLQKTLLKRR